MEVSSSPLFEEGTRMTWGCFTLPRDYPPQSSRALPHTLSLSPTQLFLRHTESNSLLSDRFTQPSSNDTPSHKRQTFKQNGV